MTASATISPAASPGAAEPFLRLSGLRKTYPGVVALAEFSGRSAGRGDRRRRERRRQVGADENPRRRGGADRGAIEIDGVVHPALSVEQSMAAGIAFVHQELNLFDNLSVAANVYIGREPRKFGFLRLVDDDKLQRAVKPFLDGSVRHSRHRRRWRGCRSPNSRSSRSPRR
jgi:ribose transport system ATP-binding protein